MYIVQLIPWDIEVNGLGSGDRSPLLPRMCGGRAMALARCYRLEIVNHLFAQI